MAYYESQKNLYIRSNRRFDNFSANLRRRVNPTNLFEVCDRLKKVGPSVLFNNQGFESVFGVDFNTGILMCIDDDYTTFVCFKCTHILQKHKFENNVRDIEPEIIESCLLNISQTPCENHGLTKIKICPDCTRGEFYPLSTGWYRQDEWLHRCGVDIQEEGEKNRTYNDDSVICLLHSCWENVFQVRLKDKKIALIVYNSNDSEYMKCFQCDSITEIEVDTPLHCNKCH